MVNMKLILRLALDFKAGTKIKWGDTENGCTPWVQSESTAEGHETCILLNDQQRATQPVTKKSLPIEVNWKNLIYNVSKHFSKVSL